MIALVIGGQIISNCYRHIDFSCQSRFETKITLREQRDEPYMFILLKHDDKILNLMLLSFMLLYDVVVCNRVQ